MGSSQRASKFRVILIIFFRRMLHKHFEKTSHCAKWDSIIDIFRRFGLNLFMICPYVSLTLYVTHVVILITQLRRFPSVVLHIKFLRCQMILFMLSRIFKIILMGYIWRNWPKRVLHPPPIYRPTFLHDLHYAPTSTSWHFLCTHILSVTVRQPCMHVCLFCIYGVFSASIKIHNHIFWADAT